ncbi:MAG TPA: site-2 protease family protein, partial [Elusimicrobiota bacterium]|nr:site-2 protease family protein [Elusimicrobiota bacterium]
PAASLSNAAPISALTLGAAALNPALGAAPSAFSPSPAAALAPAAAAGALLPASAASVPAGAAPSAEPSVPGPAAVPAPAGSIDAGPRWVGAGAGKISAPPAAQAGPRWVAPAKSGVKAWLGRQLAKWTGAAALDPRRMFDGDSSRAALDASAPAAAGPESARLPALAKPQDETSRIIEDATIPTPEAARRVGELRHEHGTPPWAKIVAPLSVIAAGVVAFHFGAVGVLTLGAGLVLSVLAHEVAHLAVLKTLGDHTAEHAGSHSLNPFHHIDAVKTVILPALSLAISSAVLPFPVLIGSGKAVDADFNNLRGPLGGPRSARNAFWVAAAGPLTNFALAGLAFAAIGLFPAGGILAGVALGLAHMNVALGVFNLLPLPQLDGGKMLASALPESWYAKWVYNPNVEKGYQGLFRRLYEGPTNLLTFIADTLGVQSQKTLNRVANGATFAALAAFYAVAYVHFSVAIPLLFLALPCTYDYWCIREKVRSEAAVKDVMDIFSVWSSVIAQIAEDRGMASEVSTFETEHAMKNALETLIDEMMAKEDFRALSDEEKIAAVMAAYPDKAADFLKDKVFTEGADTKEKILELLKDSRNTPFYDRLTKWFTDHDIFKRWDNPKYEGKLRDQMKEADKPKSRGQGGSTTLGMLGFLALLGGGSLLIPGLAHHAPLLASSTLGLFGLAGTLMPGSSAWKNKLKPRPGDATMDVRVRFAPSISVAGARSALSQYPNARQENAGNRVVFRLHGADLDAAAGIARDLAQQGIVDMVSVPSAIFARLNEPAARADRAAHDQADGFAGDEDAAAPEADKPAVDAPAPQSEQPEPAASEPAAKSAAPAETPEQAQAKREAEVSALADAKDEGDWAAKIAVPPAPADGSSVSQESRELIVALVPGLSEEVRAKVEENIGAHDRVLRVTTREDGRLALGLRFNSDDYAEVARELAQLKAVASVTVSGEVRDRLFAVSLPAKIASHGKEHWSTGAVLVRFAGDATEPQIKEILGKAGQKTLFRQGDAYVVNAGNASKAAIGAVSLAKDESVAAVEVHPNVAAALENRSLVPYPAAESYDPAQAVLVQFKKGTGEGAMKEYAEARRLRLIYPQFRGGEDL